MYTHYRGSPTLNSFDQMKRTLINQSYEASAQRRGQPCTKENAFTG